MGGPKETGHTSQDVVRNGLRWALASAQYHWTNAIEHPVAVVLHIFLLYY